MANPTEATGQRVYETRITRAVAPRGRWLASWRGWRWDVTTYGLIDRTTPGVYDGRVHLWSDHGYTFTRLGAALAVAREITLKPGGASS